MGGWLPISFTKLHVALINAHLYKGAPLKILMLTMLTTLLCAAAQARSGRILGEENFFADRIKLTVDSAGVLKITDSQQANKILFQFALPAGHKYEWELPVVKPFKEFTFNYRRKGDPKDARGLHFLTFTLVDAKNNTHWYTIYGSLRSTGGKWIVMGAQLPGFVLRNFLWSREGYERTWTEYYDIKIPGEPSNNDLILLQTVLNGYPMFSVFDIREMKILFSSSHPSGNHFVSCGVAPAWDFYAENALDPILDIIQVTDYNSSPSGSCDTGWILRLDLKNKKFIEEKRWNNESNPLPSW
jgi:hypothetical protein